MASAVIVHRFAAGAKGEVALHQRATHAELVDLYVAPAHRGQGVGRALLRRALRYAAKHCLSVRLRPMAFDGAVMSTPALVEFYARYGFVKTSEREMVWCPE